MYHLSFYYCHVSGFNEILWALLINNACPFKSGNVVPYFMKEGPYPTGHLV